MPSNILRTLFLEVIFPPFFQILVQNYSFKIKWALCSMGKVLELNHIFQGKKNQVKYYVRDQIHIPHGVIVNSVVSTRQSHCIVGSSGEFKVNGRKPRKKTPDRVTFRVLVKQYFDWLSSGIPRSFVRFSNV